MPTLFEQQQDYTQLTLQYDGGQNTLWCSMNPSPRPCFNIELLDQCRRLQRQIWREAQQPNAAAAPVQFLVLASALPGVFNLGGDLALFVELIRRRDRDGLQAYAKTCIDVGYQQSINLGLGLDLTTISLVQGEALGGGFEAALSCGVLVAERQAQMGLPEIHFNLFPGMGALNFLARRIGVQRAEKLITSGKLYSAEELYELGVVDVLAEPGTGVQTVQATISKRQRAANGYRGLARARQCLHQEQDTVSYESLLAIAEVWVDTALALGDKDLKMMERLVRAQNRRAGATEPAIAAVPPATSPAPVAAAPGYATAMTGAV